MPPAVVAIAAVVATVAVQTFVTSAIVAAILTIAINVAATLLTRRPKQPQNKTNQGQEVKLKLDPTMPRQLGLGRIGTGGSVVWAFTYGSVSGVPQNAYLVRIIALQDLPINGGLAVYDGKIQLVFTGDPTAGWVDCSNRFIAKDGTKCMSCRVYKGSNPAVADANLISWSGGQWTANHKGTNMAYAIVRYRTDPDGEAFPSGEPMLVWVFDGVKCYDDRFDGSKPGRTGPQRIDQPGTWVFTKNAGVITAQSLRGFYSNGVLLFGAEAEDRDLSDSMLLSAYNTCDENVVVGAGPGTQKRYEVGIMVSCGEPLAGYLTEFQAAMDGRILDRGGAITILPGATRTPVFNLTDDDVNWSLEKSWQPKATLNELYNHVVGSFIDEQTIFQEKGYPPLRNTTWEAQDGGERLTFGVSFGAVTDWTRVQRITKRIHEASRFQGTIAFVGPLWLMEMEQGDWFTFTSSRWGFTTKYFDAVVVDVNVEGQVIVVGREVSPVIDGWNPVLDERPRNDTFWNPPSTSLPVPNILGTAPLNIYELNGDATQERVGLELVPTNLGPMGLPTSIEFEMAFTSNLVGAWSAGSYPAAEGVPIRFYGLLPETNYSIRARTSDGQWFSDWTAWYQWTTISSAIGLTVTAPTQIEFLADHLGQLLPGQLPFTYAPVVMQGQTNRRTHDDTGYAIAFAACTGTIVQTDGDPNKGAVTINTIETFPTHIDLYVGFRGYYGAPVRTILVRKDAPIPPPTPTGGGGGGGGAGQTSVVITSFTSPTTVGTFTVVGGPVTVTTTAGQQLYGSGVLSYNTSSTLGASMNTKWQYSPAGAGTWTDFGAAKVGSQAYPKFGGFDDWEPPQAGSVDTAQNINPGSAGNWDVRLVGTIATAAGPINNVRTTALVEAKV